MKQKLNIFFLSFMLINGFILQAEAQQNQNLLGLTNQPTKRVNGQCNNDEWHTCIAGRFESLPGTQTYHYWLCRGLNGGLPDVCYQAKSNEASRTNIDGAELYRIEVPIVRRARASYLERQEVQDLSVDDHPIENITPEIFRLLRITNEIDEVITDLCGWMCAVESNIIFSNVWHNVGSFLYNDVEFSIIEQAKQSHYGYNNRPILPYRPSLFEEASFSDLPQIFQRLLLLTWDKYYLIRDWERKMEGFHFPPIG